MSQAMNQSFRLSIAAIISAVVTFALLFLMQLLIASGKPVDTEARIGRILDFVRVIPNTPIITKPPIIDKIPPPTQPPKTPPRPPINNPGPTGNGIHIGPTPVDPNIGHIGRSGFSNNGDYLPIVKVSPIYPRQAQSRGIEGYALLEFTVTRTGAVTNPAVIRAEPANYFERAAMAAVVKFKYKPRVVDGEAIDVPGVQNLFRFELADQQ